MAFLQGTAGNAATTRWVQRQPAPEGDAAPLSEERRHALAPTAHGEWGTFREEMFRAGFPDDLTEVAWQLVLGGLADQGQLNTEAAKLSGVQEQRDHMASNTWFQDLVKLVGDGLGIDTPTLALWSGGAAVSDYARAKGHTPLESTPFGHILDKLEISPDWSLKLPMWSVVSKAFVSRATGPVHIFLRAYDPESVLVVQEIPQLRLLQKLNPAITFHWHPVYTTAAGELMEVTSDLELAPDVSYASRDLCVRALYEYLRLEHDRANQQARPAHADMSARLAANGSPQDP
ncbi:hypothetical protein [Streptomyces sp. NPDC050504]|uniref:hypothetical protein n=1 Tax=Streptomyces sp. NPDC050504 TaxID=3365618 RepID=UPI0037B4EDE7